MRANPECLRCKGPMEPGYIIDRRQHSVSSSVAQTWFEGQPERSFWTGLRTKGRRSCEVRTFRCTRCGYLESYAA
jgi:hypothetical protein